jgi:hypothetical protein
MWKYGMGLGLLMTGALVLTLAPAAPAVQEPGDEYIFVLDDANSFLKLDWANAHVYVGQTRLRGWLTAFLSDPTPGNPRTWNVHCVLGKCNLVSLDPIDMIMIPNFQEVHWLAGNLIVEDMDIWYQDANEWADPNTLPDPNKPPKLVDPNAIAPGDPNVPTYDDPNDPNYSRWADLTGGPAISTGRLNSEVLFYSKMNYMLFGPPLIQSIDFSWSRPFGPWTVQIADANYLDPNRTPDGPVQIKLDWSFWAGGGGLALGTLHVEAAGGKARRLNLNVSHSNWGSVTVDPAPPSVSRLDNKYPDGTNLTLTGVPIEKKSFKEWTIYDPNYPGDMSHAVTDSNNPITIVMNADWEVTADFKCGSGMEPFIGMSLFLLALGVAVRRFR